MIAIFLERAPAVLMAKEKKRATAPAHPERDADAVGTRLAACREAMGLSQVDLCKRLGISKSKYNNWETGKNLPSVVEAQKLCDAFGYTLDWIYRGDAKGLPYSLAAQIPLAS